MILLKSICQHIGKLSSGHWIGKGVFFPIPKKGNAKECSNYRTIALISHASKVMLKILQARLRQSVNWELSDVKAGFRKGRGTRDQIANIPLDHGESKGVPEKHLLLLHQLNESLCVAHNKLENSWRDRSTRPPYLSPEKPVCRSRSKS